jgi:putative tributyrin esterase
MSQFFTTEKATFHGLDFITLKSNALKKRADITVYMPLLAENIENLPLVILLHGVYGSHWAWAIKGKVHETLDRLILGGKVKPMLLVMPSDGLYADGSAYHAHQSEDYEAFITKDLIACIKEQYTQASDSSAIFISGLSMGGYGALRLGAKYPEIFKAFSGLSSITDFDQLEQIVEDFETLKNVVKKSESVIEWILANKTKLSPFRFDCGKEDQLIEYNRTLNKKLIENKIPHTYTEHTGAHSWEYWEKHIAESLVFFNENL